LILSSLKSPVWEKFQDNCIASIFQKGGKIIDISGGLKTVISTPSGTTGIIEGEYTFLAKKSAVYWLRAKKNSDFP